MAPLIGKKAKVAQLVERNLAKVKVAGSRPVFRSKNRKVFNHLQKDLSCLDMPGWWNW